MRGLPPLPPTVLRWSQGFAIGPLQLSTGLYLFNPSLEIAQWSDLKTIADGIANFVLPTYLGVMHSGCTSGVCRLTQSRMTYIADFPPSSGSYTAGQASNCAMGICWVTGRTGRGANHIEYLPGVPDEFIKDNVYLSGSGFNHLAVAAEDILTGFTNVLAPNGEPVVPCTVSRILDGAPRAAAQVETFVGGKPTLRVVTCRRRVQAVKGVSTS